MTAAPISLYLSLKEGEYPDLETVGRVALAWNDLIKAIAAEVDPDLTVKVDFVGTEEGSLWLKNLVENIRAGDKKAVYTVIVAVLFFFAMGPAEHLRDDFTEWLLEQLGHDHSEEDSKEAVAKGETVAQVVGAREGGVLIREVARDGVITGVGAAPVPTRGPPPNRIPREAFAALLPTNPPAPSAGEKKTDLVRNLRVYAIKPNLREGVAKPRWRFEDDDGGEYSADIEDGEFIDALREKTTGIMLGVRPPMRVDLAIDEVKDGEDWRIKNRRVLRVISPAIPRRQISLFGDE